MLEPGKVWHTLPMDTPQPYPGKKLDVDWTEIYWVWATEAGQNVAETARLTGLARRTVAYHHDTENWPDRYIHDHYGLSEQDLNLARIDLRALLKDGIRQRLRSVILDKIPVRTMTGEPVFNDDGTPKMMWRATDKDAVNAMRIVSQYTLDPARGADMGESLPATFRVHASYTDTELTPQDQAIAILEDNAAAANTRIRTRRDGYT